MTATNTSGDEPGKPGQRQPDAELIGQLAEYKREHKLTDDRLGKLLGVSGSMINRALNQKFEGNEKAFEARVADFLKNEATRRRLREEFFETGFTRNLNNFLETVRRTNDVGLAYSPAGTGKTVGKDLYLSANPTAVGFELEKWNGGSAGLERHLFATVDTRGYKRCRESRGDFLVSRFRGSNRLIIIDNAQRLTAGARQWLFDFHNATKCPIALLGNPEVLDKIRQSDQELSRVGLRRLIKNGSPKEDVSNYLRLLWPDCADDAGLFALAVNVIKGQGHGRALHKQLSLAKDIHAGGEFGAPAEAFRAAHTQLIRDYKLEEGK